AVAGEVNAIGRAPWVDQLALGVKIFSAPDIDDDFLRVVAAKSLDDFRVVARWIGASEFLEFLEGVKQVVQVLVKTVGAGRDVPAIQRRIGPSAANDRGDQTDKY